MTCHLCSYIVNRLVNIINMLIKFEEELQRIIARRAHELAESANSNIGDDTNDWLNAEREILQELDSRSIDMLQECEITAL